MYLSQQSLGWPDQFGPSLANTFDTRPREDRETRNPEGQSYLTGPIASTLGSDGNIRLQGSPRPVPRLHGSDARANYRRANAGTGVPFLFGVQGSGVFPNNSSSSVVAGKPPRNHLNDNVRHIRHVMREVRQRQAVKEQSQPIPVKALWRSKQYDHVQSKVKQRLDEDTQRSYSRPQSAQGNFLRAHENTGPEFLRAQSAMGSRRGSVTSVRTDDDPAKPDYVKINSRFVKTIPQVRKTMSEELVGQVREKRERDLQFYHEKQKGRVPDYIDRIKEKRAQDQFDERANAPDPDCPLGHVKINGDQRVSTLTQLQTNRTELETKLQHLPIRNDSLTLRRTKEEIERKIVELDEAIRIFSKPKVFIRLEE